MSTISNDTIKRVWTQTVRYVAYKIHGLDLSKAAEDIATEAIEFALKNKKVTWDDTPASEKHLVATARKVAKWTICKEIKKAKRALVSYKLDSLEKEVDGESHEISKAEADHLTKLYHEEEGYRDAMEMGRVALSKLPAFLIEKGVSKRDICIYKEWDLYKRQTDVVCGKYGVTPSNLHRIVCVVKRIITAYGRALVDE